MVHQYSFKEQYIHILYVVWSNKKEETPSSTHCIAVRNRPDGANGLVVERLPMPGLRWNEAWRFRVISFSYVSSGSERARARG